MSNEIISPRILIYQNNDCTAITNYLISSGFEIISSNSEDVYQKIKRKNFDACILDHYESAKYADISVLKYLRKLDDKIPVIFISGVSQSLHIIEAFNTGIDDYIIRPYNFEELVCRIKSILKRTNADVRKFADTYNIGKYIFNVKSKILSVNFTDIELTDKETRILTLLCAYKNELLPKKMLVQYVWKDDNYFNKRSLDVYMCRLRKYLEDDDSISINTMRGIGYSLVTEN